MSKIHKRGPTTPEMNMTPMIDVTFQLIIFFMLVNNIVADQEVEMIPPELVNSKTREFESEHRVAVNVAPMDFTFKDRKGNPLLHDGRAKMVRIRSHTFALDDMDGMTAAIVAEKQANPQLEIILRADAAIYYEEVQRVMAAIAAAQVENVHLAAYMPDMNAAKTGAAVDEEAAETKTTP